MRVLAIFALSFVACASAPKPAPPVLGNAGGDPTGPHVLMATIERTMCYGTCPAYKVSIYRDGAVEYAGDAYVKTKGAATGHISPDQVAELDGLFAKAHYLDLDAAYTHADMTDMPSVSTSYILGDKHHAVEHYFGDTKAPQELRVVEEGIDRVIGIEQWIGTQEERDALPRD
ncbi:MAG: DUF6438 domain-containing protein [Deltaproteobacteria bacterium]|nr:DUF6438 domain-containing protein [Deltaproteobacteria bacterium]